MIVPRHYEDPHMLHENTMPNRSYYIPASGRMDRLAEHREESDRFQLLNGDWRFRYYKSIYDLQEEFFRMDHDASRYDVLPVPGVWQNYGYDNHQYTNLRYPFPADPPYVPQENPCGAYIHEFVYEQDAAAPKAFLNFEGVDSCFYVWLNGQYVGYSQVSHATSEFDVTEFLHNGMNRLAVLVLKWCDGSYLEDQDKFRMSGIFRDVYLLKRPEQTIQDYFITTELNGDSAAVLIRMKYYDLPTAARITVFDADGLAVGKAAPEENPMDADFPYRASLKIQNPHLWNAEQPYLYTLVMETAGETIVDRIGIREIHIENNRVIVNGKPIKFHGINRHDSDPVTGYTIGPEQYKKDLLMMKQNNFNAIRTSHYPNVPYFYQLCDQHGFYVVDEADHESHGAVELFCSGNENWLNHAEHWNELFADNPDYIEATVDRTQRCVMRDKNRPCVVVWSMGNESAYGCAFEEALAWTKKYDPTRLTHYESAKYHGRQRRYDFSNLDLYSNMYPSLEEIQSYLDHDPDKPYIMCEYSHSMGNGPGDLEDYFEVIQANDGVCGGFIWEWCDHGIYKGKAKDGRSIYYYGGDHGEFPHDGNFCMDGMVYPDRRPSTGLYEFKNVNRPARVVRFDQENGSLTLHNYMDFVNLEDYITIGYEINCDGTVLAAGEIALPEDFSAEPHQDMTIPFRVSVPEKGKCFLKVIYRQKQKTELIESGDLLGFDELPLENSDSRNQKALALWNVPEIVGTLQVKESDHSLVISCDRFVYVYSKLTGLFDKMTFGNESILDKPMELNIWRAPTDNDSRVKQEWYAAHYDRSVTRAYTTDHTVDESGVTLHTTLSVSAVAVQKFLDIKATWHIANSGAVTVTMDAKRNTVFPELPRFGLRLFLPKEMNSVTYYGIGPMESYADKHRAGSHSEYAATVEQLHEDYIRPQENGSHYDCDHVTVEGRCMKLAFVGPKPFCFNASVYTQEELTEKKHNYELEPCGSTVLCLDYKQNGIGSESCGPRLLKKYRLDDAEFRFTLRMIPAVKGC